MPFSKIAHAAALEKVAAADLLEQRDAIDAGFEHACDAMNLSEQQRDNLAKLAAVVLDVAKPTEGLAKVAADFTEGDTDRNSVTEQLFRLQLEAQQNRTTPEILAKKRGIDIGKLRSAATGGMPAPAGPVKPAAPVAPKPPVAPAPPVKPVVAPKPAASPAPVAPAKPAVPPSPTPPVIPGGAQ